MRFSPKLRAGLNQVRREMIIENRILDWNTKTKQGDYGKIIVKLIDCYAELKAAKRNEKDLMNKIWSRETTNIRLEKLRNKYKSELRLMEKRYKLCEQKKKEALDKLYYATNFSQVGKRGHKIINRRRVKI